MVKTIKYIIILMLTSLFTFVIVDASNQNSKQGSVIDLNQNFPYIEKMLLESSRYTQKDDYDQQIVDDYHDFYQLNYTDIELEAMGYELIMDNDKLTVYLETLSFSVIIKNKDTNYFYSSRGEFQGTNGASEGNTRARARLASGIWIEYVNKGNVQRNQAVPFALLELAEAKFNTNGIVNDVQSRISVYELEPETYRKNKVEVKVIEKSSVRNLIEINAKAIGFKFNVELSITADGYFKSRIMNESIVESGDIYAATAIYLFPNFGSTRLDLMPGYMVIPDGVGALVRFNKLHKASMQARFYGSDYGVSSESIANLSVPLYGMVHEVEKNGFYAYITEGAEQSVFYANLTDNNSYNRAYSKFVIRDIYYQSIDRAGNGADTIRDLFTNSTYEINYGFLGTNATYVGIANAYKNFLLEEDILTKSAQSNDIDLHLSVLMSDKEPSFIWQNRIKMTSSNQVLKMYNDLKAEGITNQTVKLLGWSSDGNTNRLDRTKLYESKNKYKEMAEVLTQDGNDILLNNDYVIAKDSSKRVNYINDVARNISRNKIVFEFLTLSNEQTFYFIEPNETYNKLNKDRSFYQNLGYGAAIESIGHTLYSYYDKNYKERQTTKDFYQRSLEKYDFLALNNPNDYLWAYTDQYLDMPIMNSQFRYYTDLIPLIPIILSGNIPMYSTYLNFNAMGIDKLLMMIDYNLYPSYVVTEKDTFEMRYTASRDLYTTSYKSYKDEIITNYGFINEALKHVTSSYVSNRVVLETGVTLVTYDNGVKIIVNYGQTAYNHMGIVVQPKNYEVIL